MFRSVETTPTASIVNMHFVRRASLILYSRPDQLAVAVNINRLCERSHNIHVWEPGNTIVINTRALCIRYSIVSKLKHVITFVVSDSDFCLFDDFTK